MISINEIAQRFNTEEFSGSVLLEENMASHTTMKVGGNAPLFVTPFNEDSLVFAVKVFLQNNLPFFVLGGGSNIIVSDKGFTGAVLYLGKISSISMEEISLEEYEVPGDRVVYCGAGASISLLVNYCTELELSGLENFAGLPGTVGGAVFMNARCFETSISERLLSVRYINLDKLEICNYNFCASDWDYKVSPFQKMNAIILGVKFTLSYGSVKKSIIEEKCKKSISERKEKGHFLKPSAGSVFKNNHSFGKPSGKIIDEVGLKGFQLGGAQVASWHGNFIVNNGNATASDVKHLVEHCKKCVLEKTGFALEEEVIFCGNW